MSAVPSRSSPLTLFLGCYALNGIERLREPDFARTSTEAAVLGGVHIWGALMLSGHGGRHGNLGRLLSGLVSQSGMREIIQAKGSELL